MVYKGKMDDLGVLLFQETSHIFSSFTLTHGASAHRWAHRLALAGLAGSKIPRFLLVKSPMFPIRKPPCFASFSTTMFRSIPIFCLNPRMFFWVFFSPCFGSRLRVGRRVARKRLGGWRCRPGVVDTWQPYSMGW